MRSRWLDRQLRSGVAPWSSQVHAARALQLTSRHHRRALARALDRVVQRAQSDRRPHLSSITEPSAEQVSEALPLLNSLRRRLRDGSPVGARGMASLDALLSHDADPDYSSGASPELRTALENVSQWLDVAD
jgi:hypothetical protein